MRIIFMGTPNFATPSLELLNSNSEIDIAEVWTQPPRSAGRHLKPKLSAINELANNLGLNVRTVEGLKHEDVINQHLDIIQRLQVEAAVVVAYGMILPKAIINAFPLGCWNLHASLLPRWRGAAPIQRAIEHGDEKSGVCVMSMDYGLDTGNMWKSHETEISSQTTAQDLENNLATSGGKLLLEAMIELAKNKKLETQPQDDTKSTYAKKLSKHESEIDFNNQGKIIISKINAFWPSPVCWFNLVTSSDKVFRTRVRNAVFIPDTGSIIPKQISTSDDFPLLIGCNNGWIAPQTVQRNGKNWQNIAEYCRGINKFTNWRIE